MSLIKTIRLFLLLCIMNITAFGCLTPPYVPSYPETGWDPNTIVNTANAISDDLDAYIRDYLDGNVGGNIPRSLLPSGANPNESNLYGYYIVKGATATNFPKRQFVVLLEYMHDPNHPGRVTDPNRLIGMHRTGQSTYVGQFCNWVPFNHKVVIKGKYPHCRFFNIQMSPPFQPYVYIYRGFSGAGEVPIVDVDIEPDAGSVNPFRIGQNRNATNRNYTVEFTMKSGRWIDFDSNHCPQPPYFRGSGNSRYASAIQYQGPWGDPNLPIQMMNQYGRWNFGAIWMRYYLPDRAYSPTAGAVDPNFNAPADPRITYYTPQSEPYYIYGDFSLMETNFYKEIPCPITNAGDPEVNEPFNKVGWGNAYWFGISKIQDMTFGGLTSMIEGALYANLASLPSPYTDDFLYIRDLAKGGTGRGESQPDIGNWENSASCVAHYSILCRDCRVGSDKVSVITGKMPTFPNTRNGDSNNVAAQCRLWVLDLYSGHMNLTDNKELGLNMQCYPDDDIVLDANRKYIIVMSTAENKPSNATSANGVTWIDNWGNKSSVYWDIRWVSVYPDHYMSPTPHAIGWENYLAAAGRDPNVCNLNRHDKYLGWYQPKAHYMTKAQFEAIESGPINPDMVPTWFVESQDGWIKPVGWTEKYSTTTGDGGSDTVTLTSATGRYIMIDMSDPNTLDTDPNYGIFNIGEFQPKDANGNNLALNKPCRASDSYTYWDNRPIWAFDGVDWTTWSSNARKSAWIYVDLGSSKTIASVSIIWGTHYPKKYSIHVSDELK